MKTDIEILTEKWNDKYTSQKYETNHLHYNYEDLVLKAMEAARADERERMKPLSEEEIKEKVKCVLIEKGYDFASEWFGDNELTLMDDIIEAIIEIRQLSRPDVSKAIYFSEWMLSKSVKKWGDEIWVIEKWRNITGTNVEQEFYNSKELYEKFEQETQLKGNHA